MVSVDNSVQRVRDFLMQHGRCSPQQIGAACGVQHNTALKDLHFLRTKHGVRIEKEAVKDVSGKISYYVYWISNKQELRAIEEIETGIKIDKRELAEYPETHTEHAKIKAKIQAYLDKLQSLYEYQKGKIESAQNSD